MSFLPKNSFFIQHKMKEDSSWRGMRVVLSGAETPGEGEHKIMAYIRSAKMQPNYDPNIRHCLYGLDADLIMLALVTHEPHFVLLREEVRLFCFSSYAACQFSLVFCYR